MKILRAPEHTKFTDDDIIIFLAGPIQGSSDWHEEFIEKLKNIKIDKNIIICSPKRFKKDHNFIYDEQVDWESFYLTLASKQGIIVFWLANEKEKIDGRSYAQTTRFEIGEWWAKGQSIKEFKIVVGAEKEFDGLKYITKKFIDHYPDFNLNSNINDMVNEIIKKIKT